MKTKIRNNPEKTFKKYKKFTYNKELKINTKITTKIFPIFLSSSLFALFITEMYAAFLKSQFTIAAIFSVVSILTFLYLISCFNFFKSKYTFYWDQRKHDPQNIKNNYNYYRTPKLEKITKSKFWKFIYFSEFYHKIIFSLLLLPMFGLTIILFLYSSVGTEPSAIVICLMMFGPTVIASLILTIKLIKMRALIYNKNNNFYYISRNSKELGFAMDTNIQGGGDYYFMK